MASLTTTVKVFILNLNKYKRSKGKEPLKIITDIEVKQIANRLLGRPEPPANKSLSNYMGLFK